MYFFGWTNEQKYWFNLHNMAIAGKIPDTKLKIKHNAGSKKSVRFVCGLVCDRKSIL